MTSIEADAPEAKEIKYLAGSRHGRPTRSRAEADDEAFWSLLAHYRKHRRVTVNKIAEVIATPGAAPGTNTSRDIANRKFTPAEKRRFLDYIFGATGEHRAAVRLIPDALYFALCEHCQAIETSQDNARIRLAGSYKLWRFSVEHENEFVLGRLDIEEDEKTQALKVKMTQPKKARNGVRGTRETASGYMLRLSNMYVLVLTDDLTRDLRVTIFPRSKMDLVGTKIDKNSVFAGQQEHVVHMDGFGLGVDGSSGFFSPVHLSLVDHVDELAELDGVLDVVSAEQVELVPQRVVEKLKRSGPLRRL